MICIATFYHEQFLELGRWAFAAKSVPMTDVQRVECLMRAEEHDEALRLSIKSINAMAA